MKELSIEEKAKAYDKALKVLHKYDGANIMFTQDLKEEMFPELRESEDEKMRKGLIGHLKECRNQCRSEVMIREYAKWIAWLEKQGEQKSTDKVELKFKVGDFIVNDYCMGRIVEITNDAYLLDTEQGIPFSCHSTRLWDITKDAKDGDVLAVNNEVFIYAHRKQMYPIAVAHCFVDSAGGFRLDGEFGYTEKGNSIHPATKEQRDLLFKKMKESGYEWDAEKKELKKIEQKPAWSEEDENIFRDIVARLHSHPNVDKTEYDKSYHWLKSFRPQNRWKPSDEQMEALAGALSLAKNCGEENAFDLRTLYEQLKKLKE